MKNEIAIISIRNEERVKRKIAERQFRGSEAHLDLVSESLQEHCANASPLGSEIVMSVSDPYIAHVMSTETLIAKFQALPPAAQRKVEALVEELSAAAAAKPRPRKAKRFKFDWAGGLEDLKDQFTAVELQRHINELR